MVLWYTRIPGYQRRVMATITGALRALGGAVCVPARRLSRIGNHWHQAAQVCARAAAIAVGGAIATVLAGGPTPGWAVSSQALPHANTVSRDPISVTVSGATGSRGSPSAW